MEEKDLQRLLDMLYGMVDEAKSAPFSAEKCTINRDEALDIITEIRSRMPIEIKKAQELIRAREEYIASAKKEVEKADGKQKPPVRSARMKSAEIIHRAEERTGELYRVANSYTEDALRRTEEAIQMALDEVRQSRVRFRAASNEQMQQIRSGNAPTAEEKPEDNGEN